MLIKKIYQKDLQEFIESGEYQKSTYLPISRIRGLSQIKNPKAKPEDLLLVMIFENDEMQAYLGILPDELHFKDENGQIKKEHAGWLSCIWVNPEKRGKGYAAALIKTVLEAWDKRILATEFTTAAKALYDKTEQFIDLSKPEGIRAYLKLNLSYLLISKNREKWSKFKLLLNLTDSLANLFLKLRLLFIAKKKVNYNLVSEFDAEMEDFINKHREANELTGRTIEDLKWMINNPWLKSGAKPDEESKRYHFSSVADFFAFKIMKVYDTNNKIAAILLLSVRDKNLKIPYAYLSPSSEGISILAVEQFMREQKLDMLTLFHPKLVNAFRQCSSACFMIRKMRRHFIISKEFEADLTSSKSISLQDGDADAAFT